MAQTKDPSKLTYKHLSEIVLFGKEHGFTDMTLPQLLELREVSKGHPTFESYREAEPEGSAKEIERIRNCEPHRRGLVLKVKRDDTADNPREICDQVGVMACWHRRRTLGDEQPKEDPIDFQNELPRGTIVIPLYLYEHSIVTMRTTPFSCKFDSGQVGIMYATPERVRKTLDLDSSPEVITDGVRDQVVNALEADVKVYDAYLRGDVWGFVLENEDGEHLYSCWGFYGDDKDGIREHLEDAARALLDAAWDKRQ